MSGNARNHGSSDLAGRPVAAEQVEAGFAQHRSVVVARVGRAHGLRGEVSLQLRTDEPEKRFAPGRQILVADHAFGHMLTVRSHRWHGGRMLVQFDGIADRNAAEALAGALLSVEVSSTEAPPSADEFYDWQLEGLRVVTVEGDDLGVVVEIVHLPGQDLLAVRPNPDQVGEVEVGSDAYANSVLVPFVQAIVPHVDLEAGQITCDPPLGLFPPAGGITLTNADVDPGGW